MTHSPCSSSAGPCPLPPSGERNPRELAGLPPLFIADENVGVAEHPNVGEDTLGPVPGAPNVEPGLAMRDGDRPPGGKGDGERGGIPDPVNFFCVNVSEKIA